MSNASATFFTESRRSFHAALLATVLRTDNAGIPANVDGDIDCVYHFALPELLATVKALGYGDAEDLLNTMIEGKRLRDIADLPLDLVI